MRKDSLKAEADKALVTARLKSDFPAELRKLWDCPDGFEMFESVSGDLHSIWTNYEEEETTISSLFLIRAAADKSLSPTG